MTEMLVMTHPYSYGRPHLLPILRRHLVASCSCAISAHRPLHYCCHELPLAVAGRRGVSRRVSLPCCRHRCGTICFYSCPAVGYLSWRAPFERSQPRPCLPPILCTGVMSRCQGRDLCLSLHDRLSLAMILAAASRSPVACGGASVRFRPL